MYKPALTLILLALAGATHAQSPAGVALPAPAPIPMERQAVAPSGDNTPPAVARHQAAELSRGDPARWHQEDMTTAERMRTLRKETAAALQENLGACRSMAAAERSACVREARATYQQEMSSLGRAR